MLVTRSALGLGDLEEDHHETETDLGDIYMKIGAPDEEDSRALGWTNDKTEEERDELKEKLRKFRRENRKDCGCSPDLCPCSCVLVDECRFGQ